jgi:NAD(P)-dependent dehydrogenase (short-subunit alcohol dehydrogenase family)
MTTGLKTYAHGVAIVTGAASVIGKAISEELARRCCEVVLADIDLAEAEAVASAICERGGRAAASQLDVTDFNSVQALVDRTIADKGRLDYLFNNAGIAAMGGASDYTLESWRRVVEVNFMGVVHGVHAAYPALLKQGFGHIVNIASAAGLMPSPSLVSYSATKHAVVGLSRALRAEAHSRGVRVSVVCPGVIRTPILQGGKHGIWLMTLPEADQRQLLSEFFEVFRPMDVAVFARRLLDRVARNEGLIVIPGWMRIPWWIDRLFPRLSERLARRNYERYRKKIASRMADAARQS